MTFYLWSRHYVSDPSEMYNLTPSQEVVWRAFYEKKVEEREKLLERMRDDNTSTENILFQLAQALL